MSVSQSFYSAPMAMLFIAHILIFRIGLGLFTRAINLAMMASFSSSVLLTNIRKVARPASLLGLKYQSQFFANFICLMLL